MARLMQMPASSIASDDAGARRVEFVRVKTLGGEAIMQLGGPGAGY